MKARALQARYKTQFLAATGVVISFGVLYVTHLFYLQFIVAVAGVATIGCIVAWEEPLGLPDVEETGSVAEEWTRAREDLEELNTRLSNADDERERAHLATQVRFLQDRLRRLNWAIRENEIEAVSRSVAHGPLKPLPPRQGIMERRAITRTESRHLIEVLDASAEILVLDPPDSARTQLGLIANDVRVHYDFLRGKLPRSTIAGDYAAAWGVLTSLSKGFDFGPIVRSHASYAVKKKLSSLKYLASIREVQRN